MVKNWEGSESLPNELARHTSMDTGKHETPGAETKDFITSKPELHVCVFCTCPPTSTLG